VRVLVENAPAEARHVIIVLDAKREQIFTARFERVDDQQWLEREPAHVDSLSAILQRARRPVYLLGEGVPFHSKYLPTTDPQVIVTPADRWGARASVVGRLGHAMARLGEFTDPDRLVPIYIRRPEAEEKWDAAHRTQS
jgi:tRNA threonylcarbamoyladenosine biosynthesis protein TsaB